MRIYQAGSNLILLARRLEPLQKVVQAAKAAQPPGGHVVGIQLDVSKKEQVNSLIKQIPQEVQDVDVLGVCFYSRMAPIGSNVSSPLC